MAPTWRLNFFFRLNFCFFVIPLKPGIYRFSGSASLLALSIFTCNWKRGYGSHLCFLITKYLVNAITWKVIRWISPIFYVMLPMSMEMTWLDFQLLTDNQDGGHLAIKILLLTFFRFPSKLGIYRFSGSASLLVLSFFKWDWKRGCGGHFGFINFNKSFLFSINCLETWHIE